MITHSGACQDLGYICEWRVFGDSEETVGDGLIDHLNHVHATGSTSPALHALVNDHVRSITTDGPSHPAHAKERTP